MKFARASFSDAFALSSSASACSSCRSYVDASSFASTCPFVTIELKSANSSMIFPETSLPTATVCTAPSSPFAVTVCTISPRSSAAVL